MNSDQIFNSPGLFEIIQSYLIPESPEITEDDKQRDINNFQLIQNQFIEDDVTREDIGTGFIDTSFLYLSGILEFDTNSLCADCGEKIIDCDREGSCGLIFQLKLSEKPEYLKLLKTYCHISSFNTEKLSFEPGSDYSFLRIL